ncbi:MAG: enoyl-CoA hydratase [Sphingobacteriales bacterium]|nr:enoyl-CoA hydratase [Sphingobacteriales bacterium]
MNYENLLVDVKNQILYITINRESKLNALNHQTLKDLHFAVTDAQDSDHVKGIILTGAGSKAFVAGADITEFANFNSEQGGNLAREGQTKVFDVIENSAKPVVAAINGFALGGGLELAMACHIRIASESAKVGLPEVSLGLIPGYGGTQRLTQLVGKGRALEIILSGDMIDANEAHRIGLVNQISKPENLLKNAEDMLNRIFRRSPTAVSAAIRAVNSAGRNDINGFEVEINEFSSCFSSTDFKEGVAAFLEKRKPLFSGK